jgi:integrase
MAKRRGNGEGSVFQRKSDALWTACLVLPNGRRKSFYARSYKEVADKLRTARREIEQGIDLSERRLTLEAFLKKWLESSAKPSVRTKTHEGYESICRVRVIPRIGRVPLDKVSPLDLQGLYADLVKAGLSHRSVHHTHRVLHRAFVQAVRWNLIARNPCDGATAPKPERSEMHPLTADQATALLTSTRDHPSHALYALAVSTGMRIGELMALRWQEVDFEGERLFVRRALQRQRVDGLAKTALVFIEPKTARSRRAIKLSQTALAALREHRRRQLEYRLSVGPAWHDQDLVFANETGGPLDPAWQSATFKETLRALGLPVIRFHDLRHTAATLLLARGVHPKVVSEMLGHATITLTLDTYSHLVPVLHDQAADLMDAILSA